MSNSDDSLIGDLGARGEKILSEHISPDEKLFIKLKGTHGEGFVATNKRFYILKWGFMAGSTFGGRCLAFEFNTVTGLDFKKGIITGTLEILTAATQNTQKSYWGSHGNNAISSDNIVTFQRDKFKLFETATKIARDLLHGQGKQGNIDESDPVSKLEKLATMKTQGIITDEEFQTMKKKILS